MSLPNDGRPQVNASVAQMALSFLLSSTDPEIPVAGSGRPFPDDEFLYLLLDLWDMTKWYLEPDRARQLGRIFSLASVPFLSTNL